MSSLHCDVVRLARIGRRGPTVGRSNRDQTSFRGSPSIIPRPSSLGGPALRSTSRSNSHDVLPVAFARLPPVDELAGRRRDEPIRQTAGDRCDGDGPGKPSTGKPGLAKSRSCISWLPFLVAHTLAVFVRASAVSNRPVAGPDASGSLRTSPLSVRCATDRGRRTTISFTSFESADSAQLANSVRSSASITGCVRTGVRVSPALCFATVAAAVECRGGSRRHPIPRRCDWGARPGAGPIDRSD